MIPESHPQRRQLAKTPDLVGCLPGRCTG